MAKSKVFGLLIAVSIAVSCSAMASSTVSVERTDNNKKNSFYHVTGLTTSFVIYDNVGVANVDYQKIEIPQREAGFPETAEALKPVDPSEVLPVANSPPAN